MLIEQLASVHKSLRIRYLWKELGFTRASTHTVRSSRFRQAKADAGLVLLCPLASPPNCEQFCCGQETVAFVVPGWHGRGGLRLAVITDPALVQMPDS
jgi:hypothetical protein